jgi:hypothetical protein
MNGKRRVFRAEHMPFSFPMHRPMGLRQIPKFSPLPTDSTVATRNEFRASWNKKIMADNAAKHARLGLIMNRTINPLRLGLIAATLAATALLIAWAGGLFTRCGNSVPANAIVVIVPYRHAGTWVFDDPSVKLVREPFVAGVPEMIDVLVKEIPDATNGFRLLFSARPFPGYQKKLTWQRGDMGGNYYKLDDPPMEGWICPAMFRYYQKAPKELYVKAELKK